MIYILRRLLFDFFSLSLIQGIKTGITRHTFWQVVSFFSLPRYNLLMQLYSALFHPEVLLLHPVYPLQGLQFNSYCNLSAALRIPLFMCSETLQFISISSQSYRFCSVLKCLFRLSPPKTFCSSFIRSLLANCFFFPCKLAKGKCLLYDTFSA